MSSTSKTYYPKKEAITLYKELHKNYSEFYEKTPDKLIVLDTSPSSNKSFFWEEIVKDIIEHVNPKFKYSGSSVHKIFFANETETFKRNFKEQAIEDLKELNFHYKTQNHISKFQNEKKADDIEQTDSKIKDVPTSKKTETEQKDINLKWKVRVFSKSNPKRRKRFWQGFSGIFFIVLVYYLGANNFMKFPKEPDNLKTLLEHQEYIFEPDSNKHQILILPFKTFSGNRRLDDGEILSQRLDSLSKADNLKLEVRFHEDFKEKGKGEDFYKKIKNAYKANHIIYGFVDANKTCLERNDKICFNYITDFIPLNNTINSSKTSKNYNSDYQYVSKEELASGRLQENMDFLMYFNAMIVAKNNKNWNKVINYSSKIPKQEIPHGYGRLNMILGEAYFKTLEYEKAIIKFYKAFLDKSVQTNAMVIIGLLFIQAKEYTLAKKYLEQDINSSSRSVINAFRLLYVANSSLGRHQENLKLLKTLSIEAYFSDYCFAAMELKTMKILGMEKEHQGMINYLNLKLGQDFLVKSNKALTKFYQNIDSNNANSALKRISNKEKEDIYAIDKEWNVTLLQKFCTFNPSIGFYNKKTEVKIICSKLPNDFKRNYLLKIKKTLDFYENKYYNYIKEDEVKEIYISK